jgi:hypothetical protein
MCTSAESFVGNPFCARFLFFSSFFRLSFSIFFSCFSLFLRSLLCAFSLDAPRPTGGGDSATGSGGDPAVSVAGAGDGGARCVADGDALGESRKSRRPSSDSWPPGTACVAREACQFESASDLRRERWSAAALVEGDTGRCGALE